MAKEKKEKERHQRGSKENPLPFKMDKRETKGVRKLMVRLAEKKKAKESK